MNCKKFLFIFLMLLVALSTVGMVSAGWFDFLGGDATFNGTLKEGSLKYDFENMTDSNYLTDGGIWKHGDLGYSGDIRVEFENASDDDLNKLNESLSSDNITAVINSTLKMHKSFSDESYSIELDAKDLDFSLNGNVLMIKLDGTYKTIIDAEKSLSGESQIKSGNITIPDKGVTILFK